MLLIVAAARFIVETSLELLGRRLRALGFDVASAGDATLEALLASARAQDRIAITTSARHPRRFADVAIEVTPRADPIAGVRSLAERYEPAGLPFSRCLVCNRPLERRAAIEARGSAPDAVWRAATWLEFCPGCGRWYWNGSHVERMRAWLERALGRPVVLSDN